VPAIADLGDGVDLVGHTGEELKRARLGNDAVADVLRERVDEDNRGRARLLLDDLDVGSGGPATIRSWGAVLISRVVRRSITPKSSGPERSSLEIKTPKRSSKTTMASCPTAV
jgi:hypothetical protein